MHIWSVMEMIHCPSLHLLYFIRNLIYLFLFLEDQDHPINPIQFPLK